MTKRDDRYYADQAIARLEREAVLEEHRTIISECERAMRTDVDAYFRFGLDEVYGRAVESLKIHEASTRF